MMSRGFHEGSGAELMGTLTRKGKASSAFCDAFFITVWGERGKAPRRENEGRGKNIRVGTSRGLRQI